MRAIPIASSLVLQKFLFFNFYASFVYFAALLAEVIFKLGFCVPGASARILAPTLLAVWTATEILRLRLG
jgi:hypothetical protein